MSQDVLLGFSNSTPSTSNEILDSLNAMQQQAVNSDNPRMLVLAGAGSGKTRVLVHKIAHVIATNQARPGNILAVTFTNKAAREIKERVENLVPGAANAIWMGTFHSISHKLLRLHFSEAGLTNNFQIIDSDDQLRLIKRLIAELGPNYEDIEPKEAQGFINRQKDEGKRASSIIPVNPQVVLLTEIYRVYEQHCEKLGLIDFAEILLRAYDLLNNYASILKSYQHKFSHILVDEFQDTNTIQYKWLKLLITDSTNITIVGDDDQSIYGWRGAKVENIQRFSKDFPGVTTVRLEQNYRSTSTILTAANTLIANNQQRLGKELWTNQKTGEKISLYCGLNEMDEAEFIAHKIQDWLTLGGDLNDIAILYRSNAQSRVIEQALTRNNLNYIIYGGVRFFDRSEIKDILAYLRLCVNTNDDTAFDRIINMPPRGLGARTTSFIRNYASANNLSLYQASKQCLDSFSAKAQTGLRGFHNLIEEFINKLALTSLPDLTEQITIESGLYNYFLTKGQERALIRKENIAEFQNAVKQFNESYLKELTGAEQEQNSNSSSNSLAALLTEVALDAGEKVTDQNAAIKLMTLHSAKGLEFPLVFLAGLEEGLFPHHRTKHNQAQLEEERRLCYVGLTRAKQKLYITYAQRRSFAGRNGINMPSRFIKELPKEHLDSINFNLQVKPAQSFGFAQAKTPSKPISHVDSDLPFKLGQIVRHPKFGEGEIIDGQGSGESAKLQINFASAGVKWLALSYAKLEIVT